MVAAQICACRLARGQGGVGEVLAPLMEGLDPKASGPDLTVAGPDLGAARGGMRQRESLDPTARRTRVVGAVRDR